MSPMYFSILCLCGITVVHSEAGTSDPKSDPAVYWMKIAAKNAQERTQIANTGVSIEQVAPDYVIATGRKSQYDLFSVQKEFQVGFEMTADMMGFPPEDKNFHDWDQLQTEIKKLATQNPNIVAVEEIGFSLEKRPIQNIRISMDLSNSSQKPGVVFLGTHHAREHISTEVPLLLAQYLVAEYRKGTPRIVNFLKTREIHIIPLVNPDGSIFDVDAGKYHMWRKNRSKNKDGTYGVDLNRNYDSWFGGDGSSNNPDDEVYHGPFAFSEPETQAVKKFVDSHKNLTMLVSFHTFSELILYPWGGSASPLPNDRDRQVFEKMADTMATWNHYTPEQSSALYVATGDTVDWAYSAHHIFGFTFELDPKSMWDGGFYPGQSFIPIVFQKNLEPCLFLIDYADNPYRVLNKTSAKYGFETDLLND